MTEEEGVVAVVASPEEVAAAAMAVGAEDMVGVEGEGEGEAEEVQSYSLDLCSTKSVLLL